MDLNVHPFYFARKGWRSPMDSEVELTPEKKYGHLWILFFLFALYVITNQDRIRFGYLCHHLFNEKLESQTDDKNLRIEDAYLLNVNAYDQIVRGGRKYLPFVIYKLQTDQKFVWKELMRDITGVDIHQYAENKKWLFPNENTGRLWLKWWQENEGRYQGNDR